MTRIGRRMRVCHVITGLASDIGGPRQVVVGLSNWLSAAGVDVTVVGTDQAIGGGRRTGNEDLEGFDPRVRVKRFAHRGSWRFAYVPGLRAALLDETRSHDVFHIHGLWMYPTSLAATIARRARVPYVMTPHGTLHPWGFGRNRLVKRLYLSVVERHNLAGASAVHLFSPSEPIDDGARRLLPRVVVLPNGLDLAEVEPRPEREAFRRSLGVKPDAGILLFLGRLHPVKGLDRLIRVFRRLRSEVEDTVLVLAGPDRDGYGATLERLVRHEGLAGSVLMPGLLRGTAKRRAIYGADVLIQLSQQEGHSMTITEALYCGIPVVISPACNFPEAIDAGAGLTASDSDAELSDQLRDLLRDQDRRTHMGQAGAALARRSYTWDRVGQNMLDLYRTIQS